MILTTSRGTRVDRPMAAGLEQHGMSACEQPLHQRVDVLLQQGLAAGDLDGAAAVPLHLVHHLVNATCFRPS